MFLLHLSYTVANVILHADRLMMTGLKMGYFTCADIQNNKSVYCRACALNPHVDFL